jgi:hypothetical protein
MEKNIVLSTSYQHKMRHGEQWPKNDSIHWGNKFLPAHECERFESMRVGTNCESENQLAPVFA